MERIYQGSLTRQFVMIAVVSALLPLGILSTLTTLAVPFPMPVTVALAVGLACGIAWQAGQVLSGQLEQLMYFCQAVIVGNRDAGISLPAQGPFYALANVLHSMLETWTSQPIVPQDEHALQVTLRELAEDIAQVAAGDLTIHVRGTTSATAGIAHACHAMVQRMRQFVMQVEEDAMQVHCTANDLQGTIEHLAKDSHWQSNRLIESIAALDEIVMSIKQVTDNVTLSTRSTDQVLGHVQHGITTLRTAQQAIQYALEQGQHACRSGDLSGWSQEINRIVQLVGNLAERTNVLALNASIEAALAGEAGQGFTIVATEVKRLAEQAAQIAQQLARQAQSLHQETAATRAAMEASLRNVAEGSQAVTQAGEALKEVEGTARQLPALIRMISLAAQQQEQGSGHLSQTMSAIAAASQQTTRNARQTMASMASLTSLASVLRQALDGWKLPAGQRRL